MRSTQLQLDLWQELKEAELAPQDSDLKWLCQGLEAAISATPKAQKLQTAATAFLQIAGIFELRAQGMLTDWEQAHSDEGPALDDDDLSELLRQSMSLELDDLLTDPVPVTRQSKSSADESVESVAGAVDKAALLEAFESEINLVEAQAQSESGAMSVAHAEDVTAWAEAITRWLASQSSNSAVALTELQQGVGLSLVEVWLGLLLGSGVDLEQQGTFYDHSSIYISRAHSTPVEAAKR